MPFSIIPFGKGWRVMLNNRPDLFFTKKPQTLEMAYKQYWAIIASERRKSKKRDKLKRR